MISIETTQSFLAQVSAKGNQNDVLKYVSDFMQKEPNVMALMSIMLGADVFKNPVTAGITAIALYEKMRLNQEEAENLKRRMK